jgi:aminoglycoside 6'-N-acetyltransferase
MSLGERLALRPLLAEDAAALRRIHEQPEVRRWWGAPEPSFPLGDEPEAVRLTILLDGEVVGMVQFCEEPTPRYRHAAVDLFVDAAHHGSGVGSEAVRRVVAQLIDERGHHRITIDPAVANAAAIRAYEKVGFRPVGVLRRYERDAEGEEWLLAGEQRGAGED